MIVEDEVRRNSNLIAGLRAGMTGIEQHLTTVEADVKTLLRMNGIGQGRLGSLEGRLGILWAIILSALATGVSVIAVMLSR